MAKKRVHHVTIRMTFDRPISAKQARYAAWNNLQGQEIYGNATGGPHHADPISGEPYGSAVIRVRR